MKALVRKNEMPLNEWLKEYVEICQIYDGEWSWLDEGEGKKITITHTDNKFYCDFKLKSEDGSYELRWSFIAYDFNYFDWFIWSNVVYMG